MSGAKVIEGMRSITISYGLAVTSKIASRRQLPVNAAGTNRLIRLAKAVAAPGSRCVVISSALVPRVKTVWRFYGPDWDRKWRVFILSVRQLGVEYLGYLLMPLTAVFAAVKIARRHRIVRLVQYNHSFDCLAISLWCKLFYGTEIIYDLEDVSLPQWRDWLPGSRVKAWRELIGAVNMRMSVKLSDLVVMPASSFAQLIPHKRHLVITGCQEVSDRPIVRRDDLIRVHFGGSIRRENGIDLFLDALDILNGENSAGKFEFIVTGFGELERVRKRVGTMDKLRIRIEGGLSAEQFEEMFESVDVSMVIQDISGRFKRAKTPSKGYEALSCGKTIIVSDVGDFGALPDAICYPLSNYSAAALAKIFIKMEWRDVLQKRKAALCFAKENFDPSRINLKINDMIKKGACDE